MARGSQIAMRCSPMLSLLLSMLPLALAFSPHPKPVPKGDWCGTAATIGLVLACPIMKSSHNVSVGGRNVTFENSSVYVGHTFGIPVGPEIREMYICGHFVKQPVPPPPGPCSLFAVLNISSWHYLPKALKTDDGGAAAAAATSLVCSATSGVSISLSWPAVAKTDAYYVELSVPGRRKPFALQTTATNSLTLVDLLPSTTYLLSVRSHPSASTFGWGWRKPTAALSATCATTDGDAAAAPHTLRRAAGSAASEDSVSLSWAAAAAPEAAAAMAYHEVGVRRAGEVSFAWQRATGTIDSSSGGGVHSHVLRSLRGQTSGEWEVVVRAQPSGATSDVGLFRTLAPGVKYTQAYRIAEFTFDPDFLGNHDGANRMAMPVYVQNRGGVNETDYVPGGLSAMDKCLASMEQICPGSRGDAFDCMACAKKHRTAVVAACGNFTSQDSDKQGWDVHWYCGIGWPESSFQRSPISEYCVEHEAAPQTDPVTKVADNQGFSQYVSCNSDETDACNENGTTCDTGNRPKDPICRCWVWSDRMLSQEPSSRTLATCSQKYVEPFVHTPQCNCTFGAPGTAAMKLHPDAAMANYVGRSHVYLPYYYYKKPQETYKLNIGAGDNLSFPRKRVCKEGQKLGDGGCTWRRMPFSRMITGLDLMAGGWNATTCSASYNPNPTGPGCNPHEEIAHTYKNVAIFDQVLDSLDRWIAPRCCGC